MRTAIALMLAAFSLPLAAATPIPPGKWSFVWKDAKGQPDRPIRVYTYRPRACDTTCPIQIVLHGMSRNASKYRDDWELIADRYKILIVAPEFSTQYWPKAAKYNLGDVAEQTNPEKWTFSAIEHLFDEVRDGQKDYRIFGHSAGGQFVQRMVLFRPDARISVAMAGNPGWYTMPEWRADKTEARFPYAAAGNPAITEAKVRQALAKRVILFLGENDTDPDDENLNNSDGAKKQGANRYDRGENFFKAATTLAGELGVKFAWELVEVPATAHDGAAMSKAAAETVYGK
ncbi:hypothetical protein [Usitatibacter palustris]|uniref:Alpha/beta hydrolase n=1 Tax=Usitatibacter palustris TaxID=2732487 RepID=A0A6M4H464_9PROT|nr:hypothetical protein [Usitatibacter palustris]QJR14105.1 hypothetical protein DSM104440_00898 [Usitatibacter palustris]